MRFLGIGLRLLFSAMVILVLNYGVIAAEPASGPLGFFSNSLHYTGEGMRYWYEEAGGFMAQTGIPYMSDQLDCKNCHVQSCDQCHAWMEEDKYQYSATTAKDMDNTCLPCHKREKATYNIGKASNTLDVHIAGGMTCMDCHSAEEVHGDGTFYHSMRDVGIARSSCGDCHEFGEDASRAHTVHKGKLDCAACHVSNSLVCMNCHLEETINKQSRTGNFIPAAQDWTLLINYDGKVTTGTTQSLVYQDQKFIAYAPFFTHAIQGQGKGCVDCHANEAVQMIKQGEVVPMAEFKDGKVTFWHGMVPCVPEQLDWPFLDKGDAGWELMEDTGDVRVQMVTYGTPLTEDQLKKLSMPLKK